MKLSKGFDIELEKIARSMSRDELINIINLILENSSNEEIVDYLLNMIEEDDPPLILRQFKKHKPID